MNDLSKDVVNWLAVGEDGNGQRVDNYLAKILKGVPKSHVYRILRSGEVRVNRQRVDPDRRLNIGDQLRIPPIRVSTPSRVRVAPAGGVGALPHVLFEDDALIALDKPAGLAVHGGSGISYGVIERMRRAQPEARFLELVHRLDRDTSGVLLIAKKRSALVAATTSRSAATCAASCGTFLRSRMRAARFRSPAAGPDRTSPIFCSACHTPHRSPSAIPTSTCARRPTMRT